MRVVAHLRLINFLSRILVFHNPIKVVMKWMSLYVTVALHLPAWLLLVSIMILWRVSVLMFLEFRFYTVRRTGDVGSLATWRSNDRLWIWFVQNDCFKLLAGVLILLRVTGHLADSSLVDLKILILLLLSHRVSI